MATRETDPRWKLTERVIASQGLAKSPRLSSLLVHIIQQSLDGQDEELTEQLIGERVFGRPAGYDPRDDNIVRAHVSRLRQRLEGYYQEEGRNEPLRIRIPRGSYVPNFERVNGGAEMSFPQEIVPPETEPVLPAVESLWAPSRRLNRAWMLLLAGVAGGVLLCLLVLGVRRWMTEAQIAAGTYATNPNGRLWSALFNRNKDTLVVPADSGLIILKAFTHRAVSPADYASGRYLANLDCTVPCNRQFLETLASHRYTSLADLQFALDLTRIPQASRDRVSIRYARDLQLEDLKNTNLILIGSQESDPWIQLFENQMNFVLYDDSLQGALRIENRAPGQGEASSYLYDRKDPSHSGYALVSFLPNLNHTGEVLLVQGFSLADTQAAAEFVTSGNDFDTLFDPVVAARHGLPHFEVLLRTMNVNGIGGHPTVVAYRLH